MFPYQPSFMPYHNNLREVYRHIRPGSSVIFVQKAVLEEVSQIHSIRRCFSFADSQKGDVFSLCSRNHSTSRFPGVDVMDAVNDLKKDGIPFTLVTSSVQPNYVIARYTEKGNYHVKDLSHANVNMEPEHVLALLQMAERSFESAHEVRSSILKRMDDYIDPPFDAGQFAHFKKHKLRKIIKPELIWPSTIHEF